MLKSLIVLALGGMAVYLVLKVREAKAEEKPPERVALPSEPEVKPIEPAKWEITPEGIVVRVDGEISVPINLFEILTPQKHLELSAKPYYRASVYAS